MTKLQRLYHEQGQSPWLDNLTRVSLRGGTLGRLVADGIRGVTANPTIFTRAIEGSDAYDAQFAALIAHCAAAMLRCSASPYHEVRFRPRALPAGRFHPLLYLRNF